MFVLRHSKEHGGQQKGTPSSSVTAITSAVPLSQELETAMKDLRLGQLLATLPERILLAEKNALPLQDFSLGLFTDEVERRPVQPLRVGLIIPVSTPTWSPSAGTRPQKSTSIGVCSRSCRACGSWRLNATW
jgi:hypothetical protein